MKKSRKDVKPGYPLIRHSINGEVLVSILCVAFIAVSAFLVYMPLAAHRFLILDDPTYVTNNPHVLSGLTIQNLKWAFTTFHAEFWHPLTWISYMIDTTIFGVRPGGYLFTNLLLHVSSSVILFYVMRYMTGNIAISGLMALLFAVHPLHVEAVAWIAERKEVLCGFFFMLSLGAYGFYAKTPSFRRYLLLLFFFISGIMSKPMIITLPFLLLLLDFWPLNRMNFLSGPDNFDKRPPLWLVLEKIPLFILTIAGGVVTFIAQQKGGGIVPMAYYSLSSRIANVILSYARYLKNTIWPVKLAVFYPFSKTTPFYVLLGCFILLMLVSCAFLITWKKYPFLLVGWFWFLGTLIPVIGLVKIGDFSMADRFMYIPICGLLIIFCFGIFGLMARIRFKKILAGIVFVSLGLCYAHLTYLQVETWKDSERLFNHALLVTKDNFFAHYCLGDIYAASGFEDLALYHFLRAVEIRPDKAGLWNSLGRAFVMKGLWKRGLSCFREAIRRKPDLPAPYYLQGCVLSAFGKYDAAITSFLNALEFYKGPCTAGIESSIGFGHDGMKAHPVDSLHNRVSVLNQRSGNIDCGKIVKRAEFHAAYGEYGKALSILAIPDSKKALKLRILKGYKYWPLIYRTDY